MPQSLQKNESDLTGKLKKLELEIAVLEKELSDAEISINIFTSQIRNQLNSQILRIHELVMLYKQQKLEKKNKRLAQKKKGKNFKEITGLKPIKNGMVNGLKSTEQNQKELKRLFKEAIVQVHPDKFANEEEALNQKATELTRQLNELYQSGDLEELKGFHEHILSGNAMAHIPYQPETLKDPLAMLTFLQRKRDDLQKALLDLKNSELFHVLETYENPLTFIPELQQQFADRISVFEKRTRQKKGNK